MDPSRLKDRYRLITWLRDIDIIGVRFLANSLPRFLIPKPNGEQVIETIHGFKLRVDPENDMGVERSLYYTGTYEKGTLHVIETILRPGDTFVDIGANIGLMTVHAALCVGVSGRVVAYEPNPETNDILQRNVVLNELGNVQVRPFAVGAERSTGMIFDHPDPNRGRATMVGSDHERAGHEVEVVALDEEFADGERVDMIKMDIEGYELEALKGMRSMLERAEPPMLIIEYSELRENSSGQEPRPIYDFIDQLGVYRFFRTSKSKERKSGLVEVTDPDRFPIHDNIYCLPSRHLQIAEERLLLRKCVPAQ
jgi:FkbM family methyltransferase